MKAKMFTLVCIVLIVTGVAFGKYSGGTGEPSNPYRIGTAEDLNDIGNHVEDFNKCFVMVNDINLADYTGTQYNIIGDYNNPFTGVFDGNGHTTSNFNYESNDIDHIGLFGFVSGSNSKVRNLTLIEPNINCGTGDYAGLIGGIEYGTIWNCGIEGGNVSGDRCIGGLAGFDRDGEISNCCSSATVLGITLLGGLIGSSSGTISDCYATGSVSGLVYVGGLIGGSESGMILRCYAMGNVIGSADIGGLVGESDNSPITECYATGSVQGNEIVGGLVGGTYELTSITHCYAGGAVSANMIVGGLIGDAVEGEITNCYARGHVDGNDFTGGFAGINDSEATACFWDVETSGLTNGLGHGSSSGVTGKTTAEMQKESTFTVEGWDFVEVWGIGENQTYPFLRTYLVGDLNHSGLVDWRDFAILAGHWLEGAE